MARNYDTYRIGNRSEGPLRASEQSFKTRIRGFLFGLALVLSALTLGLPKTLNAATGPVSMRYADEIRVTLMNHLQLADLAVTPRAASLTLVADGSSYRLDANESIQLRYRNGQVEARFGRKSVKADLLLFELDGAGAFDVDGGSSSYMRTYTGDLEISAKSSGKGLSVVNRVPIEDYVASVVGAEYGLNDREGAKAMAVVARTYALHALERNTTLLDSERSQVYKGLQKANSAARQAAAATAGQILTYNGNLIEAVYSASNGGKSASNASVWGTNALPYLQSRKDPFDARTSPHATWTWEMDEGKLEKALSNAYGLNVRSVRISRTAKDGRVVEVELKGRSGSKTISGSAFRATLARAFGAMTVKSTYFDLKDRRGQYVFEGRGFGHGVGLSQWGAHGMALDGRSYEEILDFYYKGTRLEQIPQGTSVRTDVSLASLRSSDSGESRRAVERPSDPDQNASFQTDNSRSSMSISRSSGEESSASLDAVSNGNATPKEKSSTFSQDDKTASEAISAENIWGLERDKKEEAESASSKKKDDRKKRKKQRRSGW